MPIPSIASDSLSARLPLDACKCARAASAVCMLRATLTLAASLLAPQVVDSLSRLSMLAGRVHRTAREALAAEQRCGRRGAAGSALCGAAARSLSAPIWPCGGGAIELVAVSIAYRGGDRSG